MWGKNNLSFFKNIPIRVRGLLLGLCAGCYGIVFLFGFVRSVRDYFFWVFFSVCLLVGFVVIVLFDTD